MALSLVTPPADVAVTLADAKAQCRIDADQHDEDGLVDGLIQAATQHVESFTHRALITQTWDETFDGFPCGYDGEIWLSKPPVSAVSSLSYIDSAGATQVWASSNYTKDLPSGPWARRARIVAAYSIPFPVTRGVINAVTVRFVCGYGADGSYVPAPITHAMKLLIAHWYLNREAVSVGNFLPTVYPQAVDALLWPFKAF
jgi:uncharacterized phiE125 gp8 family phage protein